MQNVFGAWGTTLIGALGASLAFVLASGELTGTAMVVVGAINAAITFLLGATHQGTTPAP